MIQNSSVITENALNRAGNVTAIMIAGTTVMSRTVVCISLGFVSKKCMPLYRLSKHGGIKIPFRDR